MRKDGSDGVVVSQPPLVEEAVARRARVLGSLEDMAVRALAMDVGVGLGLAMGVDRGFCPVASARPAPIKPKGKQAGHSPERAVEGRL